MCGIAGLWYFDGSSSLSDIHLMTGALVHRGPDDHGTWTDDDNNIAMGHRRLSILDLSPTGHQPMVSKSGRYIAVFNGEIYNFNNLKKLLNHPNTQWVGHSDTEIMLACFDELGLEATFKQMIGMFAVSVWDTQNKSLTLARDRVGEKPLYYGWQGRKFFFASELKSIKSNPHFNRSISKNALTQYFQFGYIPAPLSIYEGIYKLKQGTFLTIDFNSFNNNSLKPIEYWSMQQQFINGQQNQYKGTFQDATDELEQLIKNSIAMQSVADVPLGAFLSGGVDSSTVVALMQTQSKLPIQTFTMGFGESAFNESIYAKEVASFLGTNHTEQYVTPDIAREIIPNLPLMFDEPFGDISALPTYLVCKLAKTKVTVALSGDAGDELFGGYSHYLKDPFIWNKVKSVPKPLRIALGGYMSNAKSAYLNKIGNVIYHKDVHSFFTKRRSIWPQATQLVKGVGEVDVQHQEYFNNIAQTDITSQMMFADSMTYLPDDILAKVDRTAMQVSLETRVPFLDHRIVEFAYSLPINYKVNNGIGKRILKEVLYRHVPQKLIDRPKMGFGVPIKDWLRGPLKPWCLDLLNENRIIDQNLLNPDLVKNTMHTHLSGKADLEYRLWLLLHFQMWIDNE
jgi:asparagine synthase (glutamine-hydrolysing)